MAQDDKKNQNQSADDKQDTKALIEDASDARKKEEKELLNRAAVAVVDGQVPDEKGNINCPWCGYQSLYEKGDRIKQALIQHIKEAHPAALATYAIHPELGVHAYERIAQMRKMEDAELALPEAIGLGVSDELDDWDYLRVDDRIKKAAEADGGAVRWCSPHNVQRYRARGFQVMNRPEGVEAPFSQNHEDGSIRSNEMVLMYIPPELKTKRDRLKRMRVDTNTNGLVNRQEQSESHLDEMAQRVFNHYRKAGMPAQNALKIANRVSKQMADGMGGGKDVMPHVNGNMTTISRG